jgi:hypothetical protein
MSFLEIKEDGRAETTGYKKGGSPITVEPSVWIDRKWMKDFLIGENSGVRRGALPDQDLSLIGLSLDKDAKHNDFLCARLWTGFVMNNKVKELLEGYAKLPPHKFYQVTLIQKKKVLSQVDGYWWFYFNLEKGENVDFSSSSFDRSYHELYFPKTDFSINTYADYINLTMTTGTAPKATKLVFKNTFDADLDFWGTRFLSNRSYISDRLCRKFKEQGIKGCLINEPECILAFQ